MSKRWNGFRFPPRDKKMDKAIIMLVALLLLLWSTGGCSYKAKPHQTKVGYEYSTKDATKDSKTSGWSLEQIFRWE